MYYASTDFLRRATFVNAVRDGLAPVVLFNPDLNLPAIEGVVTVVGPWAVARRETQASNFLINDHHCGWQARCRVHDMQVVEVLNS